MTSPARFWQLLSPLLPVGAFAHSQGLETAIARGAVCDAQSARAWISGLLHHALASVDLPLAARVHAAWSRGDRAAVAHWDAYGRACRDTAELRAQDVAMGAALGRCAEALGWPAPAGLGFVAAFSVCAASAGASARQTLLGFAFAWCENQVAVAVKLVPLGHVAGQRVLSSLIDEQEAAVAEALACSDQAVGRSAPGAFLASAWHECLEPRLFRS